MAQCCKGEIGNIKYPGNKRGKMGINTTKKRSEFCLKPVCNYFGSRTKRGLLWVPKAGALKKVANRASILDQGPIKRPMIGQPCAYYIEKPRI